MKLNIIFFILIVSIFSCKEKKQKLFFYHIDTNEEIKEPKESSILKKKVSICVIPCSNGHEFELSYLGFTTILIASLSLEDSVELIYFPSKKFKNNELQGVYDKKYAKTFLEKVNADFIIMSKYNSTLEKMENQTDNWGYEIKILNTKTLEQKKSIGSNILKKNEEIYKDINSKYDSLLLDINSLIKK